MALVVVLYVLPLNRLITNRRWALNTPPICPTKSLSCVLLPVRLTLLSLLCSLNRLTRNVALCIARRLSVRLKLRKESKHLVCTNGRCSAR